MTADSNLVEFETVKFSRSSSLYILYVGQSVQETFTGIPTIHVESVEFPDNVTYQLTTAKCKHGFVKVERRDSFSPTLARGFAVSVSERDNYTITYSATSTHAASSGSLAHDGRTVFAVLDDTDTFFGNVTIADNDSECVPLATTIFTPGFSVRVQRFKIYGFLWLLIAQDIF
jgi:hypothetical protein